ncbi:protein of unknown function [Nitrospina watsonii]|uniref:Uncharacterized protein n=1 Tax=Nitrospina watsonii TaxID=1323948 RepID=A0ABN8VVS4_9BACT|nr:protein of unknown function [Nitrospina watsonii]
MSAYTFMINFASSNHLLTFYVKFYFLL